jgi:hypothetical protein
VCREACAHIHAAAGVKAAGVKAKASATSVHLFWRERVDNDEKLKCALKQN